MIKPFVLCCLIIAGFFSCKSKQEKIEPVEKGITESVYASGIVKMKDQYQVFPRVNGKIDRIMVSEGDLVNKGDPLIGLENVTALLNARNARVSADYATMAANAEKLKELSLAIDQARTKMENDALLLERQRNLWSQQIGTRNELEQRELNYKNSANAYESSRLKYTDLKKEISLQEQQSQTNWQISRESVGDYTVKSEINGKVYRIFKEKGEVVNTQTQVALVGDSTVSLLELQVDEYDIARIKPGQKIVLTMDSYKGQVFEAVVEKIYPLMDERSKTFTVDADWVKQPPVVYPFLTCEANIIIRQKEKALLIPRSCLLEGDSVLLGNREKRKVTVGLMDYGQVEILKGLTIHDILLNPLP